MGSVIGVLHQQLVPVFADIDPHTYNNDSASIREKITPKTGAIMAIHMCGNPCDMDAIMAIAKEHNLIVIEDAAQAWGARYRGTPVGLIGDYGCYSFNDYKHLSCGDGGMVGTNSDEIGSHLGKWGDKCYNRITNVRNPDELTHNYRMSEPLSAICTAQLGKHDNIVSHRVRTGTLLNERLAATPGISIPKVHPEDTHSFYNYMFRLKFDELTVTKEKFIAALQAEGVNANEGSTAEPVYSYTLFQTHNFYAGTWPARDLGLTTMDYTKVSCPVAETFLNERINMPINEAMSESYVEKVALAINTIAKRFAK
jgi:dTDP-4-amino-4,6-dideoxygalactose transaminase